MTLRLFLTKYAFNTSCNPQSSNFENTVDYKWHSILFK
jgi:hypothetical protein